MAIPSEDQKKDFYKAARDEIVQRVTLRDQTLVAYIAAAGAYFGFILSDQMAKPLSPDNFISEMLVILVLPILSLVFTYVILQHHIMIGKMGDFTRSLFPEKPNHWDQYYVTWEDRRYLSARTLSQALLLILPVAYTLSFLPRVIPLVRSNRTFLVMAVVLFLFIFLIFILIVRLHIWAYQIRKRTDQVDIQRGDGSSVDLTKTEVPHASPLDCGVFRPFGRTLFGIAVFRAWLGLFVLCIYSPGDARLLTVCLVVIIAAQVSDHIDGLIARTKTFPTVAGYLQDSVADKIFHVGCLIPLAINFQFVPVLLWCVVARELIILGVRAADRDIETTLKKFRWHSILHVGLLRTGIFAFIVGSFDMVQSLKMSILIVAYSALSAGACFGFVKVVLVAKALALDPRTLKPL